MTLINRSALVEYSDQQMFDLVNDIAHYPKFMQGCTSAKVLSQSDTELVGELRLSKVGISPVSYTHLTLPTNREV